MLADIPRVNRWFTFLCFATPPAAGSAVSVIFNGGAVYCIYSLVRGRIALSKIKEIEIVSLILLAYCLVAIGTAAANGTLRHSMESMLALLTFAFFPFSYAYWSVSRKDEVVAACITGAAVACATGFVYGACQVAFRLAPRAEGGAGNALVFATVLIIAVSITISGAMIFDRPHRRYLWVAAALGIFGIMMSMSRTPLMLIAINALLLSRLFVGDSWFRKAWLPIVAVLLMLAMFAASGFYVPYISARFTQLQRELTQVMELGNYGTSSGVRIAIWEIGIDLWKEAPWFGHGARFAAEEMGRRLTEIYGVDRTFTHFHNFAMQALVERGILGLLSLLVLLGYPLYIAFRTLGRKPDQNQRFGAALLIIVLVTYVGSGLTNVMFGHDILDAVFMTCLVPGMYLAVGRSMAPAHDTTAAEAAA